MVAGALILCAIGGFAMGLAWATDPSGLTSTTISGPRVLDESQVVTQDPTWGVIFKTKGLSDVWVVRNVIVPGGHTGWHSHPGPSIISVVSGTATEYRSDNPVGVVHQAGTAFVDVESLSILGMKALEAPPSKPVRERIAEQNLGAVRDVGVARIDAVLNDIAAARERAHEALLARYGQRGPRRFDPG